MSQKLDAISEGLQEHEDLKSEAYEPWLEDRYGRHQSHSFDLDPVRRGVEVSPEKKQLLKQSYLDFLKKVYARAGYADETSGRGSSTKPRSKWLAVMEAEAVEMERLGEEFAKRQNIDVSWYNGAKGKGLPDLDLFDQYLLPCAAQLAERPEDVDQIFEDALACLEDLMITKFWASSSHGVNYGFYQAFFKHPSSQPRYSHQAESNFAFHYAHYGRKFALLVAAIQGKQEDEHYDGGSYSFRQFQLDDYFLAPFEKIPRQYHDEVLDVAINLARHGRGDSVTYFLQSIPAVIAAFEKTDDPSLLKDYFDLCRHNRLHLRDHGSLDIIKVTAESTLPFFLDGKSSVKNIKALAALGPHKPAVMDITRFLLDQGSSPNITFIEQRNEDWHSKGQINFSEVIQKLRAKGKDEDEIGRILTIGKNHPWLEEHTSQMITGYTEHDEKHPGGTSTMIGYLEKIQGSKSSIERYILGCKNYPWDHPQINDYLDLGVRLVAAFPNLAAWFFVAHDGEELTKNICDNIGRYGVEKFQAVIDRLKASSKRFVALEHHELAGQLMEHIFLYLIDDPRLDDLLQAIDEMAILNADEGERRDYFAEIGVINACEFLLSGAIHNWGDKSRQLGTSPQGPSRIREIEIVPSAKILGEYVQKNGQLSFRDDDDVPLDLIRQGFDPRIALQNHFGKMESFEQHYDKKPDFSALHFLLELRNDKGPDAVIELARCVYDAREAIKSTLQTDNQRGFLPQVAGEEIQLSSDVLREQIAQLDQMMLHPACSQAKELIALKRDLLQAQQLVVFREILKGGSAPALIRRSEPQSELLANGSETTRIILSGAALLSAIGALNLPGVSAPQLPQADRLQRLLLTQGTTQGADTGNPDELLTLMGDYQGAIQERVGALIPKIEQLILAARREAPGLMPEGGKIHTLGTLDENLIGYVQNLFGLGSTSFRLIHSGKTLLLPPAPTAFELQLLIAVLAKFGVMDTQSPDLQVAMGGRLPENLAAISGISVMLSTDVGIKYASGAFKTTHDETGSRIMAYDAGVKIPGLPYDRAKAEGRTDMLGRRSLLDIQHYRVVHTLLTDLQHGGIFHQLGREYEKDFSALMRKYELEKLLQETTWIFNPDRNNHANVDSVQNHESVVAKVSEAWFRASEMVDFGLIGEMRELIQNYYLRIQKMREQIIQDDPNEYQKYLKF